MEQIIISSDITYPNPTNVKVGDGVLGKTITFKIDEKTISVHYDNVLAFKVNSKQNKSKATYERLVFNSGACYQDVSFIDKSGYGDHDIEDIFGEDQVAFISSDGVFITHLSGIASLIEIPSTPSVTSQPITSV